MMMEGGKEKKEQWHVLGPLIILPNVCSAEDESCPDRFFQFGDNFVWILQVGSKFLQIYLDWLSSIAKAQKMSISHI